jgi:hypothetical protein
MGPASPTLESYLSVALCFLQRPVNLILVEIGEATDISIEETPPFFEKGKILSRPL